MPDSISLQQVRVCLDLQPVPLLFPTERRLCVPIINRIYQKLKYGLRFDDIKVYEELVIDGHHRYIAHLLAGIPIAYVPSHKTSATQRLEWAIVEFVEEEWDTHAKIQMLNQEDARFNDLTLQQVTAMTG